MIIMYDKMWYGLWIIHKCSIISRYIFVSTRASHLKHKRRKLMSIFSASFGWYSSLHYSGCIIQKSIQYVNEYLQALDSPDLWTKLKGWFRSGLHLPAICSHKWSSFGTWPHTFASTLSWLLLWHIRNVM